MNYKEFFTKIQKYIPYIVIAVLMVAIVGMYVNSLEKRHVKEETSIETTTERQAMKIVEYETVEIAPDSLSHYVIGKNENLDVESLLLLSKDSCYSAYSAKAYQIVGGNLWEIDICGKKEPKMLIDDKEDILAYDTYYNGNLIAYSVLKNKEYQPYEVEGYRGDTVVLVYNADYKSEILSFSDSLGEIDNTISGLKFSPNGNQLFITNNALRIVDVKSEKISKYNVIDLPSMCGTYNINDISPSGKHILITQGCMEGSSQSIISVSNGEYLGHFSNFYTEGGSHGLKFLSDTQILGLDYPSYDSEDNISLNIYNLEAKKIKVLDNSYEPQY